jgi:hypothetical protein
MIYNSLSMGGLLMKFETPFPKNFPEVGDVIRFTCTIKTIHSYGVTAEQIDGRKLYSTVEVLIVGRHFDEATGLHYLVTSDNYFLHICKCDGWESEGRILIDNRDPKEPQGMHFEPHRTKIHALRVVRKHL